MKYGPRPRYWQNTTRRSFWNSTFFVYYLIKHVSTYGLSWALMSYHKCSFWLISTHEHSWVWCYGAISAHGCWWMPMAPWRHAHDCSWALMTAHCSMLPSSWVFMAAHDCSWAIMHTPEYLLALMSTQKQPNTARSAHNYSWGDMNTHDICAMEQWTLEGAQEESWPWGHGAMGTHYHSWALIAL